MTSSFLVLALLATADAAAASTPATPSCRREGDLVMIPAPAREPQPLIVMFERDPWLMAVGSDFPTTVIYEDGQVIFTRRERRSAKAMSGRIDASAAKALRDSAVAGGFMTSPAHTDCAPGVSDQRTVEILLRKESSWQVASAYGISRDGACAVVPPKAFVEAYKRLAGLQITGAKAFEPEEIDVMLWGFEYARGAPLPWPKEVPAPPPGVVPEEYEPYSPKAYHHIVAGKFGPRIDKLVEALDRPTPPRAMLLNNHKWSVVPRWLWPGWRSVEAVLQCARMKGVVPVPPA